MQVSVENISGVERRLTIVVPAAQVEEAYTKHINEFAKKANIKGFRPGKAPLSYIKQRFGTDAHKEALSELIEKYLTEAMTTHQLKPIAMPRVEPKVSSMNGPFEFVATVEILPEIAQVTFNLPEVEKLKIDLTDADIDRVMTQLQKQYTEWQVVDRAAEEQDRVVIDYYAIFDGKEDLDNKVSDFPLELNSKVMIPGFESGLIGTKVGEQKTLNLTFPADFNVAEQAGKPVDFVVTTKQVFEANVPQLDEALIKRLGVKSGLIEDLKQQIHQSLDTEKDRSIKEKLKEQVFSALLEQNPVEVPPSLIAREAKNIHDEFYPQHRPHDHGHHSEQELTVFKDVAKKRVSLGLLITTYAKQANLEVDKVRVNARIQEIASAYEDQQEVVQWLSAPERLAGIESQIIEEQVLEHLLTNVPAVEKVISYAELKGLPV